MQTFNSSRAERNSNYYKIKTKLPAAISIFQRRSNFPAIIGSNNQFAAFRRTWKLIFCVECRSGCAILSIPGVSVKRNVSTVAEFICATGRPVDRGIKNVSPGVSIPLDPGVRPAAERRASADNKANMIGTVQLHSLVKCDCFAFTIGYRT